MIGLVLSTYNGEKYLLDQLESIRKQTLKVDKVIIKDDCSTDDTVKYINEYIQKNQLRWQVVQNTCNLGWKRNFITGLEYLKECDYVFFCDQDDIWDYRKVELTIKAMVEHNAEAVCTNYELYYSSNSASKVLEKERRKQTDNNEVEQVKKTSKNFYIQRPGCTMCVSKELINKCACYYDIEYPHDALFWKTALLDNRLYIINTPLLKWRRHSSNESTQLIRKFDKRKANVEQELKMAISLSKHYKDDIAKDFFEFAKLRNKLFSDRKFTLWLKLLPYLNYYVSTKSYLGDLYLCVIKK